MNFGWPRVGDEGRRRGGRGRVLRIDPERHLDAAARQRLHRVGRAGAHRQRQVGLRESPLLTTAMCGVRDAGELLARGTVDADRGANVELAQAGKGKEHRRRRVDGDHHVGTALFQRKGQLVARGDGHGPGAARPWVAQTLEAPEPHAPHLVLDAELIERVRESRLVGAPAAGTRGADQQHPHPGQPALRRRRRRAAPRRLRARARAARGARRGAAGCGSRPPPPARSRP